MIFRQLVNNTRAGYLLETVNDFQCNGAVPKILKRELVQGADYDSPEQAQADIFKYIETYDTPKMSSDFIAC